MTAYDSIVYAQNGMNENELNSFAIGTAHRKPVQPIPTTTATANIARSKKYTDLSKSSTDFYGFSISKTHRSSQHRNSSSTDTTDTHSTTLSSSREKNEERERASAAMWEKFELIKDLDSFWMKMNSAEVAAADDDDDGKGVCEIRSEVAFVKKWKREMKRYKKLAKATKEFGIPRTMRGNAWYLMSGAKKFERNAKQSYERLLERANREDGRGRRRQSDDLRKKNVKNSSSDDDLGEKNRTSTSTSESDDEDDDVNNDDAKSAKSAGILRTKSDKQRAKEEWATQIDLDVDRTFPENETFRKFGKEPLRRILRAYSRRNPKTGYCQGMNYIAAFIWLVVRNSENDETDAAATEEISDSEKKTFWIFTAALDGHALCREIHARDLRGTLREFGVLHSILMWRKRKLGNHLNAIGVDFACCEPRWLVCVFLESFPSETVARIFDSLFAEGFKVWHRIAVSQILKCEKDIMTCLNLPEVAGFIRKQLEKSHDAGEVMERAFGLRNFKTSKITKLRQVFSRKLDIERENR
jgi:TBC1 domain family member 2A